MLDVLSEYGFYMSDYLPRLIDDLLKDELRLFGAAVIIGPKWCGKQQQLNKTISKKCNIFAR